MSDKNFTEQVADLTAKKLTEIIIKNAPKVLTESQIQSSCVIWLWNTYPETRGLFFSVTNNSEHIARAMQRKALGLVSGVSDCLFIWNNTLYCFEFKTLKGHQSPAQIEWQNKVNKQHIQYYVVRSLDQFQTLIKELV